MASNRKRMCRLRLRHTELTLLNSTCSAASAQLQQISRKHPAECCFSGFSLQTRFHFTKRETLLNPFLIFSERDRRLWLSNSADMSRKSPWTFSLMFVFVFRFSSCSDKHTKLATDIPDTVQLKSFLLFWLPRLKVGEFKSLK